MLVSASGCHVGDVDMFSRSEDETLPSYCVNLTTAVTAASMVSHPEESKYSRQVLIETDRRSYSFLFLPELRFSHGALKGRKSSQKAASAGVQQAPATAFSK